MAFPGLYNNEVMHVSTEPTTVPTAAVLTHVLHLLMYLLIYVCSQYTYYSTYCTRTYHTYRCQYVLRTDIPTNCTVDARTYILGTLEKQVLMQNR